MEPLAPLDEKIAENDAQDTPNARWRAADAVYEKAELIERRDGEEAALPLYADVVRRLQGCSEPGPRGLLISALNAVAVIHDCQGRETESRAVAEALVDEHFDDAPIEAGEAVANATILLAWHLRRAGEGDRVPELMERVRRALWAARGPGLSPDRRDSERRNRVDPRRGR